MPRVKVSILVSSAFLLIVGIGFLGFQGWPAEAARLSLWLDHDDTIPTATPITGTQPPEFPTCPAGFDLLDTFDDYIRRDIEPKSHSYLFSLTYEGDVHLQGWVMEGHPDLGCPGHPDCDAIQDHEDIIFEIDGDVLDIYEDLEHGPYENAWYHFGPMQTSLAAGSHTITFRHTLLGEDAQSVGYRFSLCGSVESSPTPTLTPEFSPSPTSLPTEEPSPTPKLESTPTPTPTPNPTSTPSDTPTVEPSLTPTPIFTPTHTSTPDQRSGLIIFGNVQVEDSELGSSERGLGGAEIHLAFASYAGKVVAVSDEDGNYRSDFIQIPIDETIRVWAEKKDYQFEPEMEVWRFYAGYVQERQINFLAYLDAETVTPITPTFTPTPTATREPIKSSCQLTAKPRSPSGYFLFEEVGKIYATDGIFNVQAGTVSTWACLEPKHDRRDHSIFHTSDSRVVLYVDTYFSQGMQQEIFRFVARAGGTHRAVDSGYAPGNFPEASIIVDNDGSLSSYRHEWYSPVPFPEGEWHLVTMTWDGYPQGVVKIFLDGTFIGQKPYDERYNDERPLADSIAIGYRPAEWLGEIFVGENQEVYESVPSTHMDLREGGIQIFDLRLYQRPLNQAEIIEIFSGGIAGQ